MNDVNPDIVIGEPIPEVEPRVDEELAGLMMRFNRRSRVFLPMMLLLGFGLQYAMLGWGVGSVILIVGFVLWLKPLAKDRRRWAKRAKAEGWNTNTSVQWDVPLRLTTEYLFYSMSVGVLIGTLVGGTRAGLWIAIGISISVVGGMFLFLRNSAREPGQICCRECEYPLLGLSLPCECPECGQSLNGATDTTDQPRVQARWFVHVGVGLIVLGLAMFVSSFFRPPFYYGLVTQRGLSKLAMTDSRAFDRMVAQPMTTQEEDELIEKLISLNEGPGGWGTEMTMQGLWLDGFLGTPAISDLQMDRILARVIDAVVLDGPSSAHVGESVRVEIESERVRTPGVYIDPWYFNRGFEFGEGTELVQMSTSARRLAHLYRDWPAEMADSFTNPGIDITPTEPGELVVRVRLVFAVYVKTKHAQMNVDWALDEDAMFAAIPIWSTVIDLEHTIEVKP